MKSLVFKRILAATIALPALSGAAWAGGAADFGCSNATLKGEGAFGVTDYTLAPPPNPATAVITGVSIFDGHGHFTQRDYAGDNLNGDDFAPPGRETGTYQVNPDCTGSEVLNLNVPHVPAGLSSGVIKTKFVISDGGRHVHGVTAQLIPPFQTKPVPTQTSFDHWMVASEVGMKRAKQLSGGMLAAAVAFPALSGAARTGAGNDFGCSNATLKGEYAFGVTVYTPPPSLHLSTEVITGIKVFDGKGKLTQRDYVGDNLAGPDFAPPGRETGTYQVNPDCTGSMVINLNVPHVPAGLSSGIIKIKFVISDGGRHVHEVVSELTEAFTSGLTPTQTSGDDWKVASEQDSQ